MKPALIEINDKLLESGMDQIEIDHLMARFLEEEAFDFVNAIVDAESNYLLHKSVILH